MRGIVEDLPSGAPLADRLPAVMQEDDFTLRFVAGFDVAFAPILATLDNLGAYLDPHLTPADMLEWLAGWVGVEFAPGRDLPARREAVAQAVRTFRRDGTMEGLRAAIALVTGGDVQVVDSGGAVWSATHGAGALPGDTSSSVHVRVIVDDPSTVDQRRVTGLVAAMKPAHIVHTVEVVS